MKKLFLFSILPFLFFSCSDNKKSENVDSLKTDSTLKAQTAFAPIPPPNATNTDTMHMIALPPVMEGDLVFQNAVDEQSIAFGKATRSKYNNVGMIFIRPKDHLYMVVDAIDSVHITPLTEWVDKGDGHHVALLRLKNANTILNEKKTTSLKMAAKPFKWKKFDPYFSWSDDAFYSSELIYKLYKEGAQIELCTLGKLNQLDLSDPLIKLQMKNKYGSNIPQNEHVVTPDELYNSPKMENIYEK